ncbi:hypothetical protein MABM_41340 [Mycobacteroides abscessus]|nr:hypothetical protein MABM_41340 [Mycobacteroides abscessus]
MPGGMKMRGGVLVGAGITAADPTALQAHPQVRPHVLAQGRTILAFAGGTRPWVLPGGRGQLRTKTRVGYRGGPR